MIAVPIANFTLQVYFYVDNIREIRWNVEAFQRLVLPHDYKEIVLAFVESHLSEKHDFDDVVQGKGAWKPHEECSSLSIWNSRPRDHHASKWRAGSRKDAHRRIW